LRVVFIDQSSARLRSMFLGLMESLLVAAIFKEKIIVELETRRSMIEMLVTQGFNH
jgi:hypothetical protein